MLAFMGRGALAEFKQTAGELGNEGFSCGFTACCALWPCRFGAVACGVAMELYVFGGVRSREDIQVNEMVTCKSEFYHDEFKR